MRNNKKTLSCSETLAEIDPATSEAILKASGETGTPICTPADLSAVTHPISQLIRFFMIHFNITKEKFTKLHAERANATCMLSNQSATDKSNTLRAVKSEGTTWDGFEKMVNVCGWNIADINITLVNKKTGEIAQLRRSDAQKFVQDMPYGAGVDIVRVDRVTM